MEDRCVMCGRIIPEGRQICPICEKGEPIDKTIKLVEIDQFREKLIELLDRGLDQIGRGSLPWAVEMLADHLIENGVTFATDNNVGSKWISVEDRLPIEEAKAHEQEWCEEYCEFLVMIERGLLPTTLYYDWEENEWFRINTALERETYKVTHWQYLPQPPKGE